MALALAFLYIVTGRLGLELAVPPGYATMVWPPSGIALAMLILYGWNLWTGVFLGSFLLNSYISGVFSFSDSIVHLDKVPTAALIAAGSSLQALAGFFLIKIFLGIPLDLKRVRDVFKLFLLSGPLACLIAATIGTATLYAFGLTQQTDLFKNWFSWWTGDVFGVILFFPLALLFPGNNTTRLKWRGTVFGSLPFLSIVAIILPLGMTFYLWKVTSENTYTQATTEFRAMAQDNENALLYRMDSYAHALVSGLAYYQNVPNLTRVKWNSYASVIPLRENYPGINGIGVIYPVAEKDLGSFVRDARKDDAPNYTIHPDTENLPYYIIKYIYPEPDNVEAIGLNIGFETHRREAADLARDTGNPAITKKILLVQDASQSPGFLLLYPIYDKAMHTLSVEQKRKALRGWIYAPFIAHNFLKNLTGAQGEYFTLRIYDGDKEAPENLIYASKNDDNHSPAYSMRKTLHIMQQDWLVIWDSTKAYEQKSSTYEPVIILVWGLFFTGLF